MRDDTTKAIAHLQAVRDHLAMEDVDICEVLDGIDARIAALREEEPEHPPADDEIEAWVHRVDRAIDLRHAYYSSGDTLVITNEELVAIRDEAVALMRRARDVPSEPCSLCNGTGYIEQGFCDGPCAVCSGTGIKGSMPVAASVPPPLVERAKEWVEELNAFDVWRPLAESGHMTRGEQIIRDLAKEATK